MRSILRKIVRHLAVKHNRAVGLWVKLCRPSSEEFALYLKRHGRLYAMGERCAVSRHTKFTDPAYVRLGDNVRLARCTIIGHDGSINMLQNAYGVRVDRVGKTDIRSNVFVGEQAILLPGITIGPDAMVAAGSVVTRDVAPGDIVAGSPAKTIGKVADYVARLERETDAVPWGHLIRQREGGFDSAIEPELVRMRIEYFYGRAAVPVREDRGQMSAVLADAARADGSA